MKYPKKRLLLISLWSFFENDHFEKVVTDVFKHITPAIAFMWKHREIHFRPPLYAEEWISRYSEINFFRLFR